MPNAPLPEQSPSDAAVPPGAELDSQDQAAISATAPSNTSSAPDGNQASSGRQVPGRGHKMEILDDTISALKSQDGPDALAQKTKGWIDRIAAAAHAGVDKVASTASSAAGAAVGATSTATSKAQDLQQSAYVAKDQWIEEARAAVQSRPLAAVGIAVLAGVALSMLLGSPDRDSD